MNGFLRLRSEMRKYGLQVVRHCRPPTFSASSSVRSSSYTPFLASLNVIRIVAP